MSKRVGREHQILRRGVAGTLRGIAYDDSEAGDEGLDPDAIGTLGKDFVNKWKNKSMYDFLNHYCGITHSKVDDLDKALFSHGDYEDCVTWFKKNIRMAKGVGEDSTYNQIIQWIGGIHIKDYFKRAERGYASDEQVELDRARQDRQFELEDLLRSRMPKMWRTVGPQLQKAFEADPEKMERLYKQEVLGYPEPGQSDNPLEPDTLNDSRSTL